MAEVNGRPLPRVRMWPALVLVVLLPLIAWVGVSGVAWAELVAEDLATVDAVLDSAEAAYRRIPDMSPRTASALRRSLNAAHVEAASPLTFRRPPGRVALR